LTRATGYAGTLTATAAALLIAASPAPAGDTTGSAGVQPPDTFFPKSGNGGYDVREYDVRLRYNPKRNRFLKGTRARVNGLVTQPAGLDKFHLDFRGPAITKLRVVLDPDGANSTIPASFKRKGQELIVSLDEVMATEAEFRMNVFYRGRPPKLTDPDGSLEGWVPTDDGAFVVGEPRGTPTWLPSNDHPTDKARFAIAIDVPKPYRAISNGTLDETVPSANGKRRTFVWSEVDQMATYLATATVGKFDVASEDPPGTPSYSLVAIDKKLDGNGGAVDRNAEIIAELEALLGTAYPFDETGAIVDRASRVGYALETQTRPIYPGPPGRSLVAHELAHQWLGNTVTPNDWSEIWLNEGFATWAEWRWLEEDGATTVQDRVAQLCATHGAGDAGFWNPPPAAVPGPDVMFEGSVYVRGGMALQALREAIGEADFDSFLQAWAQQDPDEPVATEGMMTLAEAISGEELGDAETGFFNDWLFKPGKPQGCGP
jgi:aminopeptidase N